MLGPEDVTTELITIQGIELNERHGVIPRAISLLFSLLQDSTRCDIRASVKCSYTEIYNESINDLLSNPPARNLRIREFPRLGMCILGVTEKNVASPADVAQCLALGTLNRITGATELNQRSSRSHTLFTLTVEQVYPSGTSKCAKLNLVDLAGSEKVSKTGATGKQLVEAQNINLSLTTLGRCIKALAASKDEHVPYRESKLTMILKEALGGNAKTALICTASMRHFHTEESHSTLQFAERAKKIQVKAHSNVSLSPSELLLLVDKLKAEVKVLRSQLQSREEGTPAPRDLGMLEGEEMMERDIGLMDDLGSGRRTANVIAEKQLKARYDRNVAELRTALEHQMESNDSLKKELLESKILIDRLNSDLHSKSDSLSVALTQRKSLDSDLRTALRTLEETRLFLSSLSLENEHLRLEIASLTKELEDARCNETRLQPALQLMQQQLNQTLRRKEQRRASKSYSEPSLASIKAMIEDLREQLAHKDAHIQEINQSNNQLKHDFAYKEAELQVKLTLAQAEIKSLTKAVCEFAGDEEKIEVRPVNLKPVIGKLMQELSTFQTQYQSSVEHFKRELAKAAETAQEKAAEMEKQLNEANERTAIEIRTNKDLQRAAKVAEIEMDSALFNIKLLKSEIAGLQVQLEQGRLREDSLTTETDQLKSEISLLNEEISKRKVAGEQEMQRIRALWSENEANWLHKVEELHSELVLRTADNCDLSDLLACKDSALQLSSSLVFDLESKLSLPYMHKRPLSLHALPFASSECRASVRARGVSVHDIKALYSNEEDSGEEQAYVNTGEDVGEEG